MGRLVTELGGFVCLLFPSRHRGLHQTRRTQLPPVQYLGLAQLCLCVKRWPQQFHTCDLLRLLEESAVLSMTNVETLNSNLTFVCSSIRETCTNTPEHSPS